jgi:photosystem II stability/assembly factor-like uncharacterized protein
MDSGPPRRRVRRGRSTLALVAATLTIALLATGCRSTVATAKRRSSAPPAVLASGQPAPASMYSANGVSCGDDRHCWAVGFGTGTTASIDATSDGGTTWSAQVVPSSVGVLAAVSCRSRLDCMAVGSAGATGAVIATTNGGETWTLGQDPAGADAVTAVDCVGKHQCLALATDGMTYWSVISSDDGMTWTREGNLPAGMTGPPGLTCPSTLLCLVAGYTPTGPGQGTGAIATTANGGSTWTAAALPTGVGILRAVACSATTCIAAGTSSTATTGFVPGSGQLLTSPDLGTTWQVIDGPAQTNDDAFAASCPDAKVCVVAGTDWVGKTQPVPTASIVTTIDGGAQWRPAKMQYVPVGMASVACPAVNRCVAVGGNVLTRISLPVALRTPSKRARPGSGAGLRVR